MDPVTVPMRRGMSLERAYEQLRRFGNKYTPSVRMKVFMLLAAELEFDLVDAPDKPLHPATVGQDPKIVLEQLKALIQDISPEHLEALTEAAVQLFVTHEIYVVIMTEPPSKELARIPHGQYGQQTWKRSASTLPPPPAEAPVSPAV